MASNVISELLSSVRSLERQVSSLQQEVQTLKQKASMPERKSKFDALEVNDLVINGSIRMGQGDKAFHGDFEGWWWGANELATIVGGAKGVAILMDGTFYQNP